MMPLVTGPFDVGTASYFLAEGKNVSKGTIWLNILKYKYSIIYVMCKNIIVKCKLCPGQNQSMEAPTPGKRQDTVAKDWFDFLN